MDPLEECISLTTALNDEQLFSVAQSNSPQQIVDFINKTEHTSLFSSCTLDSCLLLACRNGRQILVQFLLDAGANVDYQDDKGSSALLICAELGFPEIFKVLIKKARNVNIQNRNKETALHLCLKSHCSLQIVKCILEHRDVSIDIQDKNGSTALMIAIESLDLNVIKLLLESGADLNFLVNSRGESAENISKSIGIGKIVQLLKLNESSSPLIEAAISRDIESLRYFIHCHYSFIHEKTSNDYKVVLLFIQSLRQRQCQIGEAEIEIVSKLLETGFHVNVFEPNVGTPISLAVELGDIRLVDLLCSYGAHVYRDVLVSAVIHGRRDLIELFASHRVAMCEFDENNDVIYDGSALDVALRNEQIDCAHVLLVNGANINQESAVCHAVSEGKKETLSFLLKHFPNCAKRVMENERKDLLHVAVEKGQCQIVALLLDAGVDINYVHEKQTPLMVAYHHEMIELLLKRGCDVNIKTDTTVLINVMSKQYITKLKSKFDFKIPHEYFNFNVNCFLYLEEIIFILLKYGADVNAINDADTTSLIMGSRLDGAHDILKLLIDHKADINYRDKEGRTALHWALMDHQTENVKVLLELGADVNLCDFRGSSALHTALTFYRRVELLNILLQYDADVNIENNEGKIPLMVGSDWFSLDKETTQTLVQAGSSVNHRNKSGKTVLMLFTLRCDIEGIKILSDAGADIHAITSDSSGEQNALSLLLSECYVPGQDECLAAAEFLLDHGITAKYVNPGIIHRAIAKSHSKFVLKLIQGGLAPQDINLESYRTWPTGIVSPLSVALFMNNVKLARCLIDIWYLTFSDVNNLLRNMSIIKYLVEKGNLEAASLLRELQPMSLTLLSFIVVSNSIGVGKDRAARINATQLPWVFKEQLLFHNFKDCLIYPNEGSSLENAYEESDKMLYTLAKHCPINDSEIDFFDFYEDSETSDDLMDSSDSD